MTQYYFITAINYSNVESNGSNVATYTPTGSPTPVVLPIIGMSPTSLAFTTTQGNANPPTQGLSISNLGSGTLTWSATENAAWLAVSPSSETGNEVVTLTVTTGNLAVGTYTSTVSMTLTITAAAAPPVTSPSAPPAAPPTPSGLPSVP